jgi:hypothetical protein
MARSFTIRKSSCLSEGIHHHCRLEKAGEVDGKFGKQLFLDFRATEGPEEGKAIRAYAGIGSSFNLWLTVCSTPKLTTRARSTCCGRRRKPTLRCSRTCQRPAWRPCIGDTAFGLGRV